MLKLGRLLIDIWIDFLWKENVLTEASNMFTLSEKKYLLKKKFIMNI